MKPNPKMVEEIKNAKSHDDIKALRSFPGLVNYMKQFINSFSSLTVPLCKLLKEGVPYVWTEKHEKAFENRNYTVH